MEIFTKTDMAKQHNLVQDLVSEVTFAKVESMLTLEVYKYNHNILSILELLFDTEVSKTCFVNSNVVLKSFALFHSLM